MTKPGDGSDDGSYAKKYWGKNKALSKLRWLCWEKEYPVQLGAPQGERRQNRRDMKTRNAEKGVPVTLSTWMQPCLTYDPGACL